MAFTRYYLSNILSIFLFVAFKFLRASRKKRPLLPKFAAQLKHQVKEGTKESLAFLSKLPLMIAMIMMTLSILLMLQPICCFCYIFAVTLPIAIGVPWCNWR